MKKRAFSATLAVLFVFIPIFSVFVFAKAPTAKLSPAFDVIAARQTMVKGGVVSEKVQFTETDFKQCLGVSSLDYIEITKAPEATDGVLTVGSMTVKNGQKIDASLLSMLTFVPSSDEVETAGFTFCGDDFTSGAEIKCQLRIGESVNYAPTIATASGDTSLEVESGKSASATLTATDPEKDSIRYEIISYPTHGTVIIDDIGAGKYTYTAYAGYVGDDSFEYVARDDWGNYTTPSSVSITVK